MVSFWASFAENLATFNSNIWSHAPSPSHSPVSLKEKETSKVMCFCSWSDTSLAFQDTRQVMNAFCQSFHGPKAHIAQPPIPTFLEPGRKI